MWTAHLMCVPPHLMSTGFEFNHSSVTILEFKNTSSGLTRPCCLGLSDISHYYAEGLPMQFSNKLYL
jgi:probable phosphoglycerate mutase